MKLKTSLIAGAALLAFGGAAQAYEERGTLSAGQSQYLAPYTLENLQGSGTLSFSRLLVVSLNLASVGMEAIPDASVLVTTSTNAAGRVRYVNASAQAPVTALTYSVENDNLNVLGVQTDGGVHLSTVKNSATNGAGFLSITDLKVDLTTKTVYADIVGANGVGTLNDHALWTYDTITGPTSFHMRTGSDVDWTGYHVNLLATNTLSGLFLVNAADIDNIFVKALNLNNTGRSGINAVNNRIATNIAGFGTITSVVSIGTVPEPSTYALMGVGLVGLALFGRRRSSR
ncbi:PEP-CTERM sorting domain-containing protein [Aquabacterium parvum]|jgi:hypothetical protein|uniref:PEP-CTERM sorting domain-containing protein n=1 Tax=Aquabacterium parvum TaxID=70584 RepID=UPI000718EA04|nr:PEP-CTERM sorting domain-containing protein [Aquabacterium parvum]MBU0914853.1 PEP-CTERM sorting domain-containing protein [Gammaproteobacteria bacterium]